MRHVFNILSILFYTLLYATLFYKKTYFKDQFYFNIFLRKKGNLKFSGDNLTNKLILFLFYYTFFNYNLLTIIFKYKLLIY